MIFSQGKSSIFIEITQENIEKFSIYKVIKKCFDQKMYQFLFTDSGLKFTITLLSLQSVINLTLYTILYKQISNNRM